VAHNRKRAIAGDGTIIFCVTLPEKTNVSLAPHDPTTKSVAKGEKKRREKNSCTPDYTLTNP
jgi:hypothetical protein